jgi:pyruvyltransferase
MREPIFAFWCRYPSARNFGDALTPWLIWKISGEYPVFAWPDECVRKYLVVGSIIEFATVTTIVWGSGLMSRHNCIAPGTTILAVRGPITRQRALECGARCPPVYGDPALLLPRLYKPTPSSERVLVGIVPHYFDKPKVFAYWRPPDTCKLIDIQQPIERVIDEITACSYIMSSSLHGLIVAHAYGIPALWIDLGKKLLGDSTKFRDYLSSVEQPIYEPVSMDIHSFQPERLLHMIPKTPPHVNTESLWESCPFRNLS